MDKTATAAALWHIINCYGYIEIVSDMGVRMAITPIGRATYQRTVIHYRNVIIAEYRNDRDGIQKGLDALNMVDLAEGEGRVD